MRFSHKCGIRRPPGSLLDEVQQNHFLPSGTLQLTQSFDGSHGMPGHGSGTGFCRF